MHHERNFIGTSTSATLETQESRPTVLWKLLMLDYGIGSFRKY
jgi:hypothetical protein